MRRFAKAVLMGALVVACAGNALADDISIQGSNELRWADGQERFGATDRAKRYFENRLDLDMYYGNFRLGSRFTFLQPSEFGDTLFGVESMEKRFLEFSDPDADLRIRVGDFYTVWGRGLTLALTEDINQGFDSGLDGFHVAAGTGIFEMEALSGRSRSGILGLVRESLVHGAHLGATLPFGFSAGAEGVMVRPSGDVTYDENRTYGGHLAYDGSSLSLWAEHAREYVEGVDDDFEASYGSASWFGGAFGVFVDYKRYGYHRFGGGGATSGGYAQSIDVLPFHSAPIVQREFTSQLFSKHPHIVRFDDEVGVQAEVTYNMPSGGTIVLAGSQSSSWKDNDNFVPTLDEEDSPFREVFLELANQMTDTWYMTAWAGMNEDLLYTKTSNSSARTGWQVRNALGTGSEVEASSNWSLKTILEGVMVDDKFKDKDYTDALFTLGTTYKQKYSIAATIEMTTEEDPSEGRDTWLKVDARAMIADRHELLLTVGQERGGLVCTSGKCRLVTPFNGVKMTFTSIF